MKLSDIDLVCGPKPAHGPRVVRLLAEQMRDYHNPKVPEPTATRRLAIARRWLKGYDVGPLLTLAESQIRVGRKADRLARRSDKLRERAHRFDGLHDEIGKQIDQLLAVKAEEATP